MEFARWRHQSDVRQCCLVEFTGWRHLGNEVAVYDCRLENWTRSGSKIIIWLRTETGIKLKLICPELNSNWNKFFWCKISMVYGFLNDINSFQTRLVAVYLKTHRNIGSKRAFPTGVLDRWHNCLLIYWCNVAQLPRPHRFVYFCVVTQQDVDGSDRRNFFLCL